MLAVTMQVEALQSTDVFPLILLDPGHHLLKHAQATLLEGCEKDPSQGLPRSTSSRELTHRLVNKNKWLLLYAAKVLGLFVTHQ